MKRFENQEEYLDWCNYIVCKLHYAIIASNDEVITKTLEEIRSTFHVSEGDSLY